MIPFFRKIRKKMADDNKPMKYLRYAIGEIALVVIGILIALGINNWNQENKDSKLGEEYLSRIHRDLVQDTISFRNIIVSNANVRNEIKDVLVALYQGVSNKEQVQHISTVYDKAVDQFFTPNQNTYNSMINSGALKLIKNLELKDAIINLYGEYEVKRKIFLGNSEWMNKLVANETMQTDFVKLSTEVQDIFTTEEMLNNDDWAFLKNKDDEGFKIIERIFSAAAWNQKINDDYYLELINSIKTVLPLIEKELK